MVVNNTSFSATAKGWNNAQARITGGALLWNLSLEVKKQLLKIVELDTS